MYKFLFRNKLAALAFVVLTVIGAATLVGTEEHDGVIAKTTQEITKQRADFAEKTAALSSKKSTPEPVLVEVEPEVVEFTDEEDLIDDALGFDPTPETLEPDVDPKPDQAGNIAEEGEVVIILNNERYEEEL